MSICKCSYRNDYKNFHKMDRSSVVHQFANNRSQPHNLDALWQSILFRFLKSYVINQ